MAAEPCRVGFVHFREVTEVRHEHGDLDYILQRAARTLQDGFHVVEYPVRLNDDVAANGITCGRITRRLAGRVEKPVRDDPLRVRPYCLGRAVYRDGAEATILLRRSSGGQGEREHRDDASEGLSTIHFGTPLGYPPAARRSVRKSWLSWAA